MSKYMNQLAYILGMPPATAPRQEGGTREEGGKIFV